MYTTPKNNVGSPLMFAQNDIGEQNNSGHNDVEENDDVEHNNYTATVNNNSEMGNNNRATTRVAPTKTIGDMMDAFKSITTVEYICGVKTMGWQKFYRKIWQRNYHEHIIRNEKSYQTISEYIINNPKNWKGDKFYK